MRSFVLVAAAAAALSPVAMSAPAAALGTGGFRGGGSPGVGLIGGPVFRGGPAYASRPTTFSDFGIAGRGLGPVGPGRGFLAGGLGGGRPRDGRPTGGRDGFGYGGAGYGGFYGGYGLALGDGYGFGGGYGYGPGGPGTQVFVAPPRPPELPIAIGIRETPSQSPAIYVIDRKPGRSASGSARSTALRGTARGEARPVRIADATGASVPTNPVQSGPLIITVPARH